MTLQSAIGETARARRGVHWLVVGVALLTLAAAGCGSRTAGSGHASTTQTIKQNWEAFFSAKTPASRRIRLLENGTQFASLIRSESKSPLASSVSAKVSDVKVETGNRAQVTYSILEAGKPVLSNRKGISVRRAGVWQVGVASFCGLLEMENGGKSSGLPAACGGGG